MKEEAIKVRVPKAMKTALNAMAGDRFTTLSEIARQAVIEYVERNGQHLKRHALKSKPRKR